MNAAARANRSRDRKNRGRRSRRQKVGHIPKPARIVDVLATARRAEIPLTDTRLASLAAAAGVRNAPSARATLERTERPEAQTSREATELLIRTALKLEEDTTPVAFNSRELRADSVGLQRSSSRIQAATANRQRANPGVWKPGTPLKPGMEVVIAPETAIDPDRLIAAALGAGLRYSESLTRETSLVVCNKTEDLRGKAMHAHRKEIPLLSDAAFLTACEAITAE